MNACELMSKIANVIGFSWSRKGSALAEVHLARAKSSKQLETETLEQGREGDQGRMQWGRVQTWKNAGGLSCDSVEEILVVHHWVKH